MSHAEHGPRSDLTDLEHRLRGWRPAAATLDRDRMLFEAGRAAAHPAGLAQAWITATSFLTLLAVALGIGWWREHDARVGIEMALDASPGHSVDDTPRAGPSMPGPDPSIQVARIDPISYLALRSQVGQFVGGPASNGHRNAQCPTKVSRGTPLLTPLSARRLDRLIDL
jgi:hypothetical protein